MLTNNIFWSKMVLDIRENCF